MKELSIFIDESGDFGEYIEHSPYYIITMVFHDQRKSIDYPVRQLDHDFLAMGIEKHCVHTGPLIRREEDYKYMEIKERQHILNKMMAFIRNAEIQHKSFFVEKKYTKSKIDIIEKLMRDIRGFIVDNYDKFISYDIVKIYYDNGQVEVSRILLSVFNDLLQNVEFKKVIPSEYKLFQAADFCCTFELIRLKAENYEISNSEKRFFVNKRDLRKNFLKQLDKKKFGEG